MDLPDWLNHLKDKGFRFRFLTQLTKQFSLEELKTLCFILNIDFDELGGGTKTGKARELMIYLERQEQLVALIFAAKALRPNVDWPKWPTPQPGGVDFSNPPEYGVDDGTWHSVTDDALSARGGQSWTFDSIGFHDAL